MRCSSRRWYEELFYVREPKGVITRIQWGNGPGDPLAPHRGMAGLSDFREFAAWQRAEELRVLCDEFLSRPGVRQRFRRAQQLDDAAASAPRNIAEGFGRFKPKVFAQFVSIAKGSETEVLNILLEARSSKFLTATEFAKFETAARRAIGTAVGLIRYLQRSEEPPGREL